MVPQCVFLTRSELSRWLSNKCNTPQHSRNTRDQQERTCGSIGLGAVTSGLPAREFHNMCPYDPPAQLSGSVRARMPFRARVPYPSTSPQIPPSGFTPASVLTVVLSGQTCRRAAIRSPSICIDGHHPHLITETYATEVDWTPDKVNASERKRTE